MSSEPTFWRPGETIALKKFGAAGFGQPVPSLLSRIHRPTRLLLRCPKGVRWKAATTPPRRPRAATRLERFVACMERCDWVLGDFEWDVSSLGVLQPGSFSSVWASERGWYVNSSDPPIRTGHGFRTESAPHARFAGHARPRMEAQRR